MMHTAHQSRLSGIHFRHFKAFAEEVALDLAPITLIAGVNSGGKSTILQALLLARQTLLTPYRSTQEDALVYDGDLVRFADFNEMVYGKPDQQDGWLGLGFTITTPASMLTSRLDDFFELSEDANGVESWEGTFESRIQAKMDIRFEHTKPAGVMVTKYRIAASLHYAHGIAQGPTLTIDRNSTTSNARSSRPLGSGRLTRHLSKQRFCLLPLR